MKKLILVVAASEMELNCLKMIDSEESSGDIFSVSEYDLKGLVTGVGTVMTMWSLLDYLANEPAPDLIINIGIAGSYNDDITTGDVVLVENDCFADSGIEEKDGFVPLWESGLSQANEFPFYDGLLKPDNDLLVNLPDSLRRVKAITLNTASGTESTISRLRNSFNPDIETMEGAAVLFAALKKGIPAIQLRSVSNKVEPRNRSEWKIELALKNLAASLEEILKLKVL